MAQFDRKELLNEAREYFIAGNYKMAEPLLNQAILQNNRNPEIYHMLATMYYDRGQFNKAIQTFKKALEVDPTYTDSSVGLSIVLNDLGRYDESKDIFISAEVVLAKTKSGADPFVEEKIMKKHIELGDLYFQYQKHEEALEQYFKAKKWASDKSDITLKIADCFLKSQRVQKAIQELSLFLREYPLAHPARLKLGYIYYQMNRSYEAVEEWEKVLLRDPNNYEAKKYIHLAKEAGITDIVAE